MVAISQLSTTVAASFDQADAAGILVRETNGAGFVTRIELSNDYGFITAFDVVDNSALGHLRDRTFWFDETVSGVQRVTLYVNGNRDMYGWEEIDAIRLLTGTNSASDATSNQAPTAFDSWLIGDTNSTLSIAATANAYDSDGDALTVTAASASHGAVSIDSSGQNLTYTPEEDYAGSDEISYTLGDGLGGTVTQTIHISVAPGAYAATVVASSSGRGIDSLGSSATAAGGWSPTSTTGEQSITLGVGSSTSIQGLLVQEGGSEGFITKIEVQLTDNSFATYWTGTDSTNPASADPRFTASNSGITDAIHAVRITVDASKQGRIDSVKFITATPIANTAPTADDLNVTTTEDVPVQFALPVSDAEGQVLRISWTAPTHGSVYLDVATTPNDPSDDYLRYVPDPDFHGDDSFEYTVTDLFGQKASGTVDITVTSVNDAPYAADDYADTEINTPITIDALANDGDAEEDELEVTDVTQGQHGAVSIEDGQIVYTPDEDFVGSDAFTYTVGDGSNTTVSRVFVQVYEAGVWAQSILGYTTQAGTTDGAVGKILGSPDVLDASQTADAWQTTGEADFDYVIAGFGSTATNATGLAVREVGGAVKKIEYRSDAGAFQLLWEGTDQNADLGDFVLNFGQAFSIRDLKIYIDTSANPYSAIDAVRLFTDTELTNTVHTRGFDQSGRFVDTEYDNLGHLPTVTKTWLRGELVQSVSREYFAATENAEKIQVIETTDYTFQGPQATRLEFDEQGRVIAQTLGYGSSNAGTTTFAYDEYGRKTSLVDPVGNVTTWEYDDDAQAVVTTDPLGHESTQHFDAQGRLDWLVDRNNRRREFTYNDDGTKDSEKWFTWNEGTEAWVQIENLTFTYANGLVVSAMKGMGGNAKGYTYTYDNQGRPIHVVEPVDATVDELSVPFTLDMGYDQYGYRNLVIDVFGNREESLYDAYGRLLRRTSRSPDDVELRIDQEFDAFGRVVKQLRYSDIAGANLVSTTDTSYDRWTGQKSSIIHRNGLGDVISSFLYLWDATGQLVAQTDYQPELDPNPITTNYGYDGQGQLTDDGETEYAFDANGNRVMSGYETGDGNPETPDDNRLATDGLWNYFYDQEGNMTGKVAVDDSVSWAYHFDAVNHLVKAEKFVSNGVTLELSADYEYDVFGNRTAKSVDWDGDGANSAEIIRFVMDGWNPSKATPIGNENWDVRADLAANGSLTTGYLRGDIVDELLARLDGSDLFWYLADNLGSLRDVVDETGAVKDALRYSGFGDIMDEGDATYRGHYAWTGRERDVETQLQFNRARYFDSVTGRWISQDPMGFDAGDTNLYRYVNNVSLSRRDPSGLWFVTRDQNAASRFLTSLEKTEGCDASILRVGDLFYIHTDERDRYPLFKLSYNPDLGLIHPQRPKDLDHRNEFLFASGAIGERLAKEWVLDPAHEFQKFKFYAGEKAAVEAARITAINGYEFQPLAFDIGGEGNHFKEDVMNINIAPDVQTSPSQPMSDNPDPLGIPYLVAGSAHSLVRGSESEFGRLYRGFLFPRSVKTFYAERVDFYKEIATIKQVADALEPGGKYSVFSSPGVDSTIITKIVGFFKKFGRIATVILEKDDAVKESLNNKDPSKGSRDVEGRRVVFRLD